MEIPIKNQKSMLQTTEPEMKNIFVDLLVDGTQLKKGYQSLRIPQQEFQKLKHKKK
jgi:hypothetical protein